MRICRSESGENERMGAHTPAARTLVSSFSSAMRFSSACAIELNKDEVSDCHTTVKSWGPSHQPLVSSSGIPLNLSQYLPARSNTLEGTIWSSALSTKVYAICSALSQGRRQGTACLRCSLRHGGWVCCHHFRGLWQDSDSFQSRMCEEQLTGNCCTTTVPVSPS